MHYDAVVIGAGNGGLAAALTLADAGKKVLLAERHNLPGGFATSFVRGRFEFEASLHELCDFGTPGNSGNLYALFEELGVLDDGSYAALVARSYASRGYGEKKLRDELYRRGVPRELWEDALAGLDDPAETLDRLLAARLKGREPDREALKKASDYLARRGFGWQDIAAALRRYGAEGEFEE